MTDQVTEGGKLNNGWKSSGVRMRAMGHWLFHVRYAFCLRCHLCREVVAERKVLLLAWSHEGNNVQLLEPIMRSSAVGV